MLGVIAVEQCASMAFTKNGNLGFISSFTDPWPMKHSGQIYPTNHTSYNGENESVFINTISVECCGSGTNT